MQAPMCACMICTYMGPARVTAFQHGINTRQKLPVARALMNRPEERTSSTPEARGRSFLSFFTYDCFPVLLFSTLFLFSSLLFLTVAGPWTGPKFDDCAARSILTLSSAILPMRGTDGSLYRSSRRRGDDGDTFVCFASAVLSLASLFFDARREWTVDLYIAFNSNFEAFSL